MPKAATYAVSTVGVKNSEAAKRVWFEGMDAAIKVLKPKHILLYGGNIGYDFKDIKVAEYKANTAFGGK